MVRAFEDIIKPKVRPFEEIVGPEVSPEGVRPLQRQPGPLKRKPVQQYFDPMQTIYGSRIPDIGAAGERIFTRDIKRTINIVPNIAKKIFSPEGVPNKLIMKYVSWNVSRNLKKEGIIVSPKEIQADIIAKHKEIQSKIPVLEVDPPEGTAEKLVDIKANIGQFATELAILKGAAPAGTSMAAIYEMENLMSGGTPGTGLLVHGAFSAPGKISRTVKALKLRHVAAVAKPMSPLDKTVQDWASKATVTAIPKRKAAVKALHKRQSARYKAKRIELESKGFSKKQAHEIAGKARAGKADIPEMSPLVLTPAERAVFDARIAKAYPLGPKSLTQANAMDILTKMEQGGIPTDYEFGLLEPVFGRETLTKVYNAIVSKKGLELWDIPKLGRDIPKAIRFGFDPQAARGLSKVTIRHPIIYLKALGKNIRGIFSKKYADRIGKAIEGSSAYKLGKESYGANYLSMRPWASVEAGTKLEQYGHVSEVFLRSKNRVIRGIGKWLRASERGANLGMNDALNKLVIKGEKDLARYGRNKNLSEATKATWRKSRGRDINIFTKRLTAKHPKGKEIQKAANWVVFSPSYTISGLASGPQSFIKLATGKGLADKTYGMQIMLSRLAGLTAVSSIVGYAGYKHRLKNPTEEPVIDSSANPADPLFGKIRHKNEVYDLGFGDVADYRLAAQIGLSAHMATKELLAEKQVTTVGKIKPPSAGEAFLRYLNSKRTLYLTFAKQLLTGKDWLGRPVTLKDTALDNLPFEFLQAFVEAGEADGLWEDMANGLELDSAKKALGNLAPSVAALGGIGTGSYPVHATTTRYKFQDIIAEQKHGKAWGELTLREQKGLKSDHRTQFAILSERVRKETIEVPFSEERIQREKTEANRRVSKMLSERSKGLVKDIDLDVGRRPKKFYLNDERYNRYQELVAQEVDERLSKVDFAGMEEKRRIARTQIIVKVAKNKALATLRREVKR